MVPRVRHDRQTGGTPLRPLAAPFDLRVYQGRAARVQPPGDGLQYEWGTEYRDEAELQRVVEQLPGKSLVLLHPDGLVAEGAPAHIVGKVRAATLVDGHALVDFEVSDPAGRDAIDGGLHELSLGYVCRTDERGFQRGTVVDHLAIVPAARCGSTCELRPDGTRRSDCAPVDAVQGCTCKSRAVRYASLDTHATSREAAMDIEELKKQLEAANKRVDDADKAFQREKERADKAELARADAERARVAAEVTSTNAQASLAAEKSRADKATQALAVETARADQADAKAKEQARADTAANFDARVNARSRLFDAANRVLGAADKDNKPIDRSALPDRDIKVAIIKHVDGLDVLPYQAAQGPHFDVFVDGVFEGALGRHDRAAESRADVRGAIRDSREGSRAAAGRTTGGLDNEETAEAKMRADTANASQRRHARR